MRLLISSLNAAPWLCDALAAQGDMAISALHAARIDLGDFGFSVPQPNPQARWTLYTRPVFPQRPYPYSLYLGGLGRVLRQAAPTLIYHLGEPSELSTVQLIRAAKRICPAAKIVLFSFENVRQCWRGFPRCLRGWAERYVLPRVDFYAACTESAAAMLQAQGVPRERIRVVYLGSDPDLFYPREADVLRKRLCPPGGFLIGYVGRLVPEKGVDLLLQALHMLPSAFVCAIIGAGRSRSELEALAQELQLGERVRWLGHIRHEQLPEYLSAFDVLVLPSRRLPVWQEQYGAVLPEAMLCGTAVVGSTCGAIPEIIADAGLLFPEGEAVALAECLRRLGEDEALRQRLAAAGRARALREFTIAAHIQRLRALFAEALATS